MSAAWIIFNNALQELTGPGAHRLRLSRACSPSLLGLKARELPQESRADFAALLQLIGAAGVFAPSEVTDRVAALNDGQVALAAEAILSVYDQLTRYQPLLSPVVRGRVKKAGADTRTRTGAAAPPQATQAQPYCACAICRED